MARVYKINLFLFLALCFIATRVVAQQERSVLISAYLDQAYQAGLFNGNILVADRGKVIFKKAIGYADASKAIPLTTEYRFHIGSVAKEFDVVGIMILKEQGKLSLNDKVSEFFPDLPSWAKKISIKNLLLYTSGLPEIKWKTVHSDSDNWKHLKSLQQLDFEPGSNYAYTNNNTFLRRRIIEKVTGIPFNQFVQQRILKVVDINNGIVDPTDSDSLIAKSFDSNFKQDPLDVPISGWTCLNVDDFYRWSQCIIHFCLLNPASTRVILLPIGPGRQSGLGGGSIKGDEVITHVHDGSALHYQALELTEATKGRTIILLSNQRQGNIYDIADAISSILDDKPYEFLSNINSK